MHEVADIGTQILISNTFHLHLTPGEDIVHRHGGLHKFMKWDKPIMTDSGGFQVFSFGFGKDHGMGKILAEPHQKTLGTESKPTKIKITDEGVHFQDPRNGNALFLSPAVSIGIQEKLAPDIMYAFDECPSPLADEEYMKKSLVRTHRWAKESLAARTSNLGLYGIVQGGSFAQLRADSARTLGAMDFDGYGIGGEFGYEKVKMSESLAVTTHILPASKPRHLLGVGHPEDFEHIVRGGADTFDCIAPTHYARHGTAFTSTGRIDMRKSIHLENTDPLDAACVCSVCTTHSRGYIAHLFRSGEITALKLVSLHNIHFLNTLAARMRDDILHDRI
jgi:queuine tRNA-ribosyltransferase